MVVSDDDCFVFSAWKSLNLSDKVGLITPRTYRKCWSIKVRVDRLGAFESQVLLSETSCPYMVLRESCRQVRVVQRPNPRRWPILRLWRLHRVTAVFYFIHSWTRGTKANFASRGSACGKLKISVNPSESAPHCLRREQSTSRVRVHPRRYACMPPSWAVYLHCCSARRQDNTNRRCVEVGGITWRYYREEDGHSRSFFVSIHHFRRQRRPRGSLTLRSIAHVLIRP